MTDHTAAAGSGPVREPIAIVGIGCRLPASIDSPAALWQALREGFDALREVPDGRWNATAWSDAHDNGLVANRRGGFLDDATGFDAEYFGISPAEARQMDPQQRIALEVACAAVEDARRSPARLAGTRTGVYVGAMWQEYALFTRGAPEAIHAHSAIGWDSSVIPSRIAYALGLRGPVMGVATASSSSLVAVHLAVQSLRSGESDFALAGGVNLMLHPNTSVAMTKLGTQSPDGLCRAFDADGDGYVRGEGCVVIVLRRLSDALADGDRVYALIHGSAVNNDGATDGLTAPSGQAQAEVLRSAWENAGVPLSAVAYSEAHGTGTPLGDVTEAGALGAVFAPNRSEPLRIGSAKTNFGHLEPAAGILGLAKVALSLHHGTIPPSLHFHTPNPRIDFAGASLEVVTAPTPWPADARFAGVSSFGFGGTNAHVALGGAPEHQRADSQEVAGPVCLPISGVTPRALAQNAERLADHLEAAPKLALADVAYSLATTRNHYPLRGAVVADTTDEAVAALRALAADESHDAVVVGSAAGRVARPATGPVTGLSAGSATVVESLAGSASSSATTLPTAPHRVAFVFPGQGAQWWAMGRALWDQSQAFRESVEACDAALAPHTGWSVAAVVRGERDGAPSFARTDVVQPALFAMYVGLAAMWRAWGVEPSAVVGHSQGEVAAAVVSGALSLQDGARVVAARARAVQEHAPPGGMGLVERPVAEVRERLAAYGDALSVAVVNTARSTVVAGDADAVDRFLGEMEASGAYCQRVDVDYASHSPHMEPLLPGLREALSAVAPRDAQIEFYSSVTGQPLSGPELDAEYWCRNLRETVRFDRALEQLRAAGFGTFVEVSPHPVLGIALAQGTESDPSAVVVGTLRRDRGGIDQALRSLAELYVHGHPVAWERTLTDHEPRTVDLPTYAFQHRHYWLDDPEDAAPEESASWRAEVLARPEFERLDWLITQVTQEAAALLGRPAQTVRPDTPLREQGFDSLTVVELRNRLSTRTQVPLPTAIAFDHPTPRAIATLLLSHADAPEEGARRIVLGGLASEAATATGPGTGDDNGVETVTGTAAEPITETAAAPTDRAAHQPPIAIVSMACRLPDGIDSPEAFWDLLADGREASSPFPQRWERWNLDTLDEAEREATGRPFLRKGGFLRDVEDFDAAFFGLSPREALSLDPQQRLVLEVAWEALERANLRPAALAGSDTGVYIGAMSSDYDVARRWDVEGIDGYKVTGNASSLISGRVAYTMGLSGPALTVDTACSSSLVALRLACAALRDGECDLALAGGVTVMSTPQLFVEFSRLGGLASDGRCKSFADDADGTSWAEGCGVLVLKRLADAERDGDRVLALVRGTAVNQDGRSQGLTAPNGLAQQRVLRQALADAGLTRHDVDVVEAHATGTVLGDPIEAGALATVFSGRERPLYLGSAKSNIGHAQAAAGVVGVIKMVLALQHEVLPRTLHADRPSTKIDWSGGELELLHEPQPWPRSARVRRAGVSSFGISGTNAHVIVEEPPAGVVHVAESADGDLAFPLVVSGIDETAVHAQARHWADWLEARQPAALRHVAYTSAVSRTHFDSRAVVFARSIPDAVEELRSLSPGAGPGAGAGVARGRTAFVFPGQGAQWLGMGRELLEHSAVFRDAVTECDAALSPLTGWSVLAVLRGDESAVPDMTRVDVVQCSLFAMYVGLAAVWRAWGVEPSAVVGHSQGEVAAAVVSGALSVPDGARVVAARARALWTHSVGGAMGLVERPSEEVAERIAASGYGSALSVAVVNSARSTVVAGDEDAVVRFLAEMEASGAFCQRVDVDYASHSARIDVLLPELRESLSGIVARRAAVPFYSSLTGEILSGPELDGEYWCRNLREPVRFDRALERLRADGFGVFVEASPHPVLGIVLAQACDGDGSAVVVGSLRRGAGGVDQLWQAVGALFVRGFPVDWKRVLGSGGARKTDVPTYAFQRQRFWLDGVVSTRIPPRTVSATPTLAAAPEPRPAVSATSPFRAPLDPLPAEHPWFGTTTTLAGTATHLFLGRLSLDDHPWLADHVVGGTVFVPGAGLIDAALWAARTAGCGAVTDLTLLEPVVLSPDRALRLQATVGDPDARGRRPFALHSQGEDTDEPYAWQQHITGECLPQAGAHVAAPQEDLQAWPVPDTKTLDVEAFYARASANGLDYGRSFQGLRELSCRDGVYYARVSLPESLDPAHYGLHPALFDAALQVVVAGLLESGPGPGPLVPFIWSGVELYGAAGRDLRVRVEFESTDSGLAPAGVLLTDVNGSPVARIGRLKFEHGRGAQPYAEHLYEVGFEPAQLVADAPSLEDTIVVGDAALGETLGVETAADLDALAKRFDTGTDVPRRLLFAMRDDDPERSAANALRSLQLCLDDARLQDTELVWVTRDAVSSNPDDEVRNWADAAVWGLIRVARTEQAERVLRLIDVDSGTLLARALGTPNEAECVVRGTTALVPRMRPASAESGEYLPRALDPDGTVLITGGLGELGGALAAHLVRGHGVRRVVLVSRRGGASTTTDSLLRELEVAGAERVDVVAADVADRSAVAAILAGIDPKHPLTAVFHLAGVLDDGLVPGFTEDRLRRVMAPKVRGARHLDELTQHLELAAFVLFSSAAGTLGTAGQGAYAAANATLDALAANRRRRGLPGLSLAFGLWEQAGVGMTAHLGKAELGRLRRQGIGALTLEEGLRALDAALARSEPYLVPVRLELASLRHALGDDEAPPLLRAMLRAGRRTVGGPGDAGGPDSAVRPDGAEAPAALQPGQSGQLGYPGQPGRSPRSLEDQIANASEADRPALLLHLVRSEAAAVLGLPGPDSVPGDKPLRSLGIDSLTMIELRKRLAKRTDTALPATLVFDYPTADAIAGLLARETGA